MTRRRRIKLEPIRVDGHILWLSRGRGMTTDSIALAVIDLAPRTQAAIATWRGQDVPVRLKGNDVVSEWPLTEETEQVRAAFLAAGDTPPTAYVYAAEVVANLRVLDSDQLTEWQDLRRRLTAGVSDVG